MSITSACVAAASAAALVAGAAFADHHEGVQLNGVYQTVNGDVTMAFGADGQMDGDSPTGIRVRDTFVIEDNVFTITAPDDHPMCPSAVGVFELAEEDGVITMTKVTDECESRGNTLDGGQWVKVEE